MQSAGKKREHDALVTFVQLLNDDGSLGFFVNQVINEELTDRQAEMVRLYYLEDLNMTEIAQMLEISPSTVSRTLNRGKGKIKKFIKYNGRGFMQKLAC